MRVTAFFRVALPCAALAALFLSGALVSSPARAGDASAGMDVYRTECSECHSISEGRNKKGPSLFGIVGRRSASVPGYHYSEAMRHTGWVWTPDRLRSYLSHPARQTVPGTKMKYDGLPDAGQLEDLLAFLNTLHH